MNEIAALMGAERTRLLDALEGLNAEQWNAPSLCAGWRIRDVAVHLLMPYEMSVPRFFAKMAATGFKFDAMADRWARRDARPPRDIVDALRATKERRFGIPGAPAEAPLCHLVIHAEDIYRPLGIDHTINPQSANIVLDELVSPKAQRALKSGWLDGLALSAHDTGWSHGAGAQVTGSASALITTLSGRPAATGELSGSGAAQVRQRVLADPPQSGGSPAA